MARRSLKSKLGKKTNARRNTKAGRKRMKPGSFALPGKKKYRIDDPAHARNALARVSQHGTPAQQARVKAAVRKKYPQIGVAGQKATRKRSTARRTRRK